MAETKKAMKKPVKKILPGSCNQKNCDFVKAHLRKNPLKTRVRLYMQSPMITTSSMRMNAWSVESLVKQKIGISAVNVKCGLTPNAQDGYILKSHMFVIYAVNFVFATYLDVMMNK